MADKKAFPFTATNYKLLLIGIAIILIGFTVISLDGEEFGFGFLGLTLGPLIVIAGFLFNFWAIFKKQPEK
jgi:hypothetical protein